MYYFILIPLNIKNHWRKSFELQSTYYVSLFEIEKIKFGELIKFIAHIKSSSRLYWNNCNFQVCIGIVCFLCLPNPFHIFWSLTIFLDFLVRFRICFYALAIPLWFFDCSYRVSHGKVNKVIWLFWGYSFWFLLIFWVLQVHEKGTFMPNSSVFIFLMLHDLYKMICKKNKIIFW